MKSPLLPVINTYLSPTVYLTIADIDRKCPAGPFAGFGLGLFNHQAARFGLDDGIGCSIFGTQRHRNAVIALRHSHRKQERLIGGAVITRQSIFAARIGGDDHRIALKTIAGLSSIDIRRHNLHITGGCRAGTEVEFPFRSGTFASQGQGSNTNHPAKGWPDPFFRTT